MSEIPGYGMIVILGAIISLLFVFLNEFIPFLLKEIKIYQEKKHEVRMIKDVRD